jgi:hypothetical protein
MSRFSNMKGNQKHDIDEICSNQQTGLTLDCWTTRREAEPRHPYFLTWMSKGSENDTTQMNELV